MLSPKTTKSTDHFTTASRKRRLKHMATNPHQTTSFRNTYTTNPKPNPSDSSSSMTSSTTAFNTEASSKTSSSTATPFRRLDGDIRRHAGIPLSGEEIVEKGNKARGVNCVSHGSISIVGRRRVMEDTITVAPSDFPSTFDFFGVYDGHGGASVSSGCRDLLHRFVGEEIEGWRGGGGQSVDWEMVMSDCFRKMDDEVDIEDSGGGGEVSTLAMTYGARVQAVGSSALVVVLGVEDIVVSNCGDSRAILCRNGEAVPLSWDQKVPDRPDERRRVVAAGGKVINLNGLRVQGVLKATRSIGDHALKPYMISDPEVTVTRSSEQDEYIIVATDGLWDVVSNEDACLVVKKCLGGETRRILIGETTKSPAVAAAMLAELAMAKGSKDNISVIVVELKKHNQSPAS